MRLATLSFATAALLALSTSPSLAKCDAYGNCYNTYGNTTRGYNLNSGRTWTQQYNGYGSQGYDSRGNYYDYNRRSGTYYNYGTGETRSYDPYTGRRRNW